uniref:Ion transport domain-containing protein n=1 Tax=Globisporangium ultimum (strain ATCC 200006 / CBS 805.95 / DAOM BR144) TaxID=431595 RepID=K3WVK9_GLOUD
MKRVVNALLSSIPSIMNVFLVCSLIFLIFGIIGVNLFKGRLYYCDMSTFPEEQLQRLESTYGFSKLSFKKLFSKADCLDEGGVWVLRNRNYNNVLKSAMTLFELGTTEGWVDIMYEGVDATEIDHHPVENYNRSYVIFFIVFIIIGSFFTLNLFVGAVIDNFNRMHESLEFSGAQNETQREWLQIQDMVRSTKLKFTVIEPHHPLRRVCYYIQQHPSFEAFVAFCVLANTIMLGITHFQESDTVVEVLSVGNLLFCVVFFLEAVVKLMSMGSKYFQDRWNIFDFLVVGGSSVSTALPFFTKGKISPVANTVRALRMGLAIRLMKRAKSMQDIVSTILENMPALINVSTLMFLVMFVYAVIGVQIYAEVKLGENLDEHANFKDISTAMLTLFRFTTGEAWNDVMYDLMVEPIKGAAPYPFGVSCVEDYSYDMLLDARAFMGDATLTIGCTPGVQVTYVYFLSYMLVTTYVLLNLFVAVILEGFEEATERHSSAVRKEDLTHVARIWQGFDASASGYISDHAFLKFLRYVPPPLGLPKHSQRKEVEQWAMQLNLYLEHGNSISFNAFLMAAAQNVMNKVSVDHGEPIEVPKEIGLADHETPTSSPIESRECTEFDCHHFRQAHPSSSA